MIDTVSHANSADFTCVRQKSKIAVHGTQADVGILLPHVHIDSLRRGMVFTGHKKIFNNFPLSAILICRQNLLLSSITVTVTNFILSKIP